MKTTILAQLLIAGGAIGLAWSMLGDDGRQTAPPDTVAAQASETKTQRQPVIAPSWGEEATLEKAADGHFYAEVIVNGAAARMLVDTGATTIALTGSDAAAMGVSWDANRLHHVAQGASGPIEGVRVNLAQVEVDGFAAPNVAAIVVPEGLPISLLGQSFLSTVAKVEIADGRMVLSN